MKPARCVNSWKVWKTKPNHDSRIRTTNRLLEAILHALATLRSATSTINVAEEIAGCENPVQQAREIGLRQVSRIRCHLDELESLLK